MARKQLVYQVKRSETPGSVPASLAEGELAINLADNIIYWGTSGGVEQAPFLKSNVVNEIESNSGFAWLPEAPSGQNPYRFLVTGGDLFGTPVGGMITGPSAVGIIGGNDADDGVTKAVMTWVDEQATFDDPGLGNKMAATLYWDGSGRLVTRHDGVSIQYRDFLGPPIPANIYAADFLYRIDQNDNGTSIVDMIDLLEDDVTDHLADVDIHVDHTTVSITGGDSLTGGGDITTNRTITLVGDAASPGNLKYYGTDGAGVKGYHTLPDAAGHIADTDIHVDHTAVSITGANSLTGGGDISANRTLELVNDAASPGNSKYYGTSGVGTKGYHDLPVDAAPHIADTDIHVDHTAVSITGVNSITGGGDISANRTVELVNDAAAPGNYKYYGTSPSGVKGYFDLPTEVENVLNIPLIQFEKSGSQSIPVSPGTTAIIDYTTPAQIIDAGDFTLNGATGEVTLVKGGRYELNGFIEVTSTTNSDRYIKLDVFVGGVLEYSISQYCITDVGALSSVPLCGIKFEATTSDIFQMFISSNGTGTSIPATSSKISIKRIG